MIIINLMVNTKGVFFGQLRTVHFTFFIIHVIFWTLFHPYQSRLAGRVNL